MNSMDIIEAAEARRAVVKAEMDLLLAELGQLNTILSIKDGAGTSVRSWVIRAALAHPMGISIRAARKWILANGGRVGKHENHLGINFSIATRAGKLKRLRYGVYGPLNAEEESCRSGL